MQLKCFIYPEKLIVRLGKSERTPAQLFFRYILWLSLIPPVSAFFGTYFYGWPFGVAQPIAISFEVALMIAIFYALALIAGFLVTAFIIKWMAQTYAEKASLKDCFAVVAVMETPILIGGFLHLYPSILLHILVLAPVFAWSVYLLFISIPILLKTDQDRGIFMGCSILVYLTTAFVSLLGFSAALWVYGIGPSLGVWYG